MRPRRMASLLVALTLLLLPGRATADRLPDRSERLVDYRIDVRLNAATKQLEGRETVTWRNPSPDAVSDLWLHLYLNAFKNTSSTFIRESGGQLRGDRMTENGWGWIDILSFRLEDGTDVTGAIAFEHPDDDNADDRTVARVALPRPVPARGSITFEVRFKAQLPEVFARSGYKRNYFLVGQWYPKLGVYEPAGMRGRPAAGWNCHQYHANSEFYADYAQYHVQVTVPTHFIVGATGERKGRIDNKNGTVTYIYEQADVHDFAWTADPAFVKVVRVFSGRRDVKPEEYARAAALLGRPPEELQLTDVEITVLMQQAHMPQLERYVQSAKAAIKHFGLWYGRYPYRTLTVVDPPGDASGSAGMEYPTFITGGTSYVVNFPPFNGLRMPEEVTVHEFGHQFWYGMVGSNEFEEAWMDEGLTTYSTTKVMEAEYGPASMGQFIGLKVSDLDTVRATVSAYSRSRDAIIKPAWMYTGDYSYYAYMKPAAALLTLEGYLGHETMARVLRTYHERWRFRHPSSADFFAVANEVSGRDLTAFFRQAFLGSDVLDYAVESVSTRPVPPTRGVVEVKGKRVTLDAAAGKSGKDAGAKYESRVLVRRMGEMVFPVQIALKFEGRPVEWVTWDGADRWKRLVYVRHERLEWAAVDPKGTVILDANVLNNARRVERDARLAAWWSARWLWGVQQMLALFGM